jgi:hypothetical protein
VPEGSAIDHHASAQATTVYISTNIKRGFIDFGRVGYAPTPNPPGKKR